MTYHSTKRTQRGGQAPLKFVFRSGTILAGFSKTKMNSSYRVAFQEINILMSFFAATSFFPEKSNFSEKNELPLARLNFHRPSKTYETKLKLKWLVLNHFRVRHIPPALGALSATHKGSYFKQAPAHFQIFCWQLGFLKTSSCDKIVYIVSFCDFFATVGHFRYIWCG